MASAWLFAPAGAPSTCVSITGGVEKFAAIAGSQGSTTGIFCRPASVLGAGSLSDSALLGAAGAAPKASVSSPSKP
jgi:hypothetical protein